MTSSDQSDPQRLLRRREALVVLGGLTIGAAWQLSRGGAGLARSTAANTSAAAASRCVLTPFSTEPALP